MYVYLQVFCVLMIFRLPCLAENVNTTSKASDSYDATANKVVTSQATAASTTPTTPSTTSVSSTGVTPTPSSSVGDHTTTVPNEISKESTPHGIISNGTKDGDVTQVDQETSTTPPAAEEKVHTSSSTTSICSDCPTSDVTAKHTTVESVKETTVGYNKTLDILSTSTDSNVISTPTPVPVSSTHDKDTSSGSMTTLSTTFQSTQNHDTTASSNPETSSTLDKSVSTTTPDSPNETSSSSSRDGTVQHPQSNANLHPTPPVHLSVLGVLAGVVCAVVMLLVVLAIYRRVTDSGKRKMLLNKETNRLDMLTLRRFTINDVKASLGGIPANGDIWHEMNKDSSIVV